MQELDVMPKWNELLLPAIKYYADGVPHRNRTAKAEIADSLNLADDLRRETYSKSHDNTIENRIGWALSALKTAELLSQHERGYFVITEKGKNLLKQNLDSLDEKYLLDNFPSYKQNVERNRQNYRNKLNGIDTSTMESGRIIDYTPEERIENSIDELNEQLTAELVEKIHEVDPYDFEKIVGDLLIKMGYSDLVVTQKSRDGGIDAEVSEDRLGLEKVFVQVKRFAEANSVTAKQVRDFLGALSGSKIQKGIFVTTSSFDKKAVELVEKSDKKVCLIAMDELAKLMIEYGIGVATTRNYSIKELDTDYFENI